MRAPIRLAIFAAGLLLAFAAAWGIGAAVGPAPAPPQQDNHDMDMKSPGDVTHDR